MDADKHRRVLRSHCVVTLTEQQTVDVDVKPEKGQQLHIGQRLSGTGHGISLFRKDIYIAQRDVERKLQAQLAHADSHAGTAPDHIYRDFHSQVLYRGEVNKHRKYKHENKNPHQHLKRDADQSGTNRVLLHNLLIISLIISHSMPNG